MDYKISKTYEVQIKQIMCMKEQFYFKRSRLLLLMLLALVVGGASPAWADELTVYDGTATNSNLPIYGYYADTKGTASEFIIPASDLADMKDKVIEQLTFYISSAASKKFGATFNVYLEEVEGENYDDSSASQLTDSKTLVYTGALDADGTTLVIPFDTEYIYNGGNLLIATEVTTAGSYTNASFYGTTTTVNTGRCNKGSTTRFKFIPKTTFAYGAANPYKKPASISVGEISTTTAVVSWTAGSDDSSETGWNLDYKKSADDSWTEVHGLGASPLSYTLTELESNTAYDVRVQAVYSGGVSNFVSSTFKTTKTATPATGFTDNFETDKGWDFVAVGTPSNTWVRGTATNNGGSNAMYISNNGGTSNAYTTSGAMAAYAAKLFSFEAGDYTISYDWKANGETTYDYLRVALVPASDELTAAYSSIGTSSLPTGWTELDGGSKLNLKTDWQSVSKDITIAEAGSYQIVFAWRNDGSNGTNPPAAIDNFKIIGAAPVLELGGDVVGTTLAFGSVAETTNKTITITNSGKVAMENIALTETADEDNVFVYADLPKTTLAANEYMDVQVTFSGSSAKDYTGTFRVAADDCDPIDVTVTATYSNSPATMAVTLGEDAVGASVTFGNVGKQATKTFTVANDGDQTLNVTIASNNTTDFTVAPAALAVTGHSSETFTVTFLYDENALDAEKTANITVTPSNEGLSPVTFAVTGTRIEQWSEDFSGNALPEGWETTSTTYWTFADGVAKSSNSNTNYYLITPSLKVEEGASLNLDVLATVSYSTLTIEKQKNNGSWESCMSIQQGSSYDITSTNTWKTFTIDGLEAGNYKFRFNARGFWLDNFQGFKRNMNDPKLGIYSDAECTAAVATSVTKDFGFATETQTATYYIKNDGTGTMTLSLGAAPDGITQSLDKTSVAAGEHATLTITMPAENKGYNGGNVVVTATNLGTFTVAVSGVIVDEDKQDLNFATDNIPATWTTNSWSRNVSGGYVEIGYSGSPVTMQTSNLSAVAGEELVVVAKMSYTSSNYSFGVKYKKQDADEWEDLIPAANIGTSYVMLHATIAEAGIYQLQFNGQYTQIQRIYGLSVPQVPVMVVYDGTAVAADAYSFGNVSDAADAVKVFTVKNEGKAALTGLAAALSGDNASHYSVEVSATTVAVNQTATVTVRQLKDNIGAHTATLTISATGLDNKVISLSGNTYDHTKLFVDFEDGNLPTGWTKGSNWNVSQSSGNYSLGHSNGSSSASSVVTTPLTVAENEELTFGAARYYASYAPTLKVRYTADGGLTWSDYTDFSTEITSSYAGNTFKELSLTDVPAGTVVLEFYGNYVRLDNIYGFTATTAPVFALTEGSTAVENNSTKAFGTLNAAGTATYTLTNSGNGDMVSTVTTTGGATVAISGSDVTVSDNQVTVPAGKSATITLTIPYESPYGDKSGAMTIKTEGWVADFTINYTATTVDPTALYVDFANNTKPEGWYSDGWSFTSGYVSAAYVANKQLITQKLACAGVDDVLSFDVWPYTSSYGTYNHALTVEYSTDRQNWTAFADQPTFESTARQTFQVKGAPAGEYYVRFTGSYVYMDNISGWHKVTGIDHDLYVSASDIPTATKLPEASITATATVYSLRAAETGIYAKLLFDDTVVATADAQDISKNGSASFTLTGNVPAEEATYAAKIVVYYSDESVGFETLTTDVTVAHTRTLEITDFARYQASEEPDELEANGDNQISPAFDVTVENTGSIALTPIVKVKQGETVVGTATAEAAVAVGESTTLRVNATNMSAGEGGSLSFTAEAYWSDAADATAFPYATPVVISVTAAAPKFELAVKGGASVTDGDNVSFGLVTAATTKTYTITNTGNKTLELVSIVAPAGFTATAVTDANKTIVVNGTLDVDVTLGAEQGKVSGALVFTYKVDASTNKTFTLNLSGHSISEDTWTENFATEIPATWQNTGWTWHSDRKAAYSGYTRGYLLTTPRLAADEDEVLTFDVIFPYSGDQLKVQYSTDNVNWSDVATYSSTASEQTYEGSFTAPAAGNYYLRFGDSNSRYVYVDNFVGFRLNPNNLVADEANESDITPAYYDNVKVSRTFVAGWNTVCLPFEVSATDIADDAVVFSFDDYDADTNELTFNKVTTLTAGKPYVVYVSTAADKDFNCAKTTVVAAGNSTYNGVSFVGSYTALDSETLSGCHGLTAGGTIKVASASATMKGFRAYFKNVPAGARVSFVGDDLPTGIRMIEVDKTAPEGTYNLNGQKVDQLNRGVLYIVNGKKVVVK